MNNISKNKELEEKPSYFILIYSLTIRFHSKRYKKFLMYLNEELTQKMFYKRVFKSLKDYILISILYPSTSTKDPVEI